MVAGSPRADGSSRTIWILMPNTFSQQAMILTRVPSTTPRQIQVDQASAGGADHAR
jgi:hypothetical protein